MRITTNKTSNGTAYYVIRSIRRNGKRTSEVVESLGTDREIMEKYCCADPEEWVRQHLDELNREEAKKKKRIQVPFQSNTFIPVEQKNSWNIGYLFLQKIYYDLMLPNLCRKLGETHRLTFDLNSVLSQIVYAKIMYPSASAPMSEEAFDFIESAFHSPADILSGFSILAKSSDTIQMSLHKSIRKLSGPSNGSLCYRHIYYYHDSDAQRLSDFSDPEGILRRRHVLKTGLYTDQSGIPLAFSSCFTGTISSDILPPPKRWNAFLKRNFLPPGFCSFQPLFVG